MGVEPRAPEWGSRDGRYIYLYIILNGRLFNRISSSSSSIEILFSLKHIRNQKEKKNKEKKQGKKGCPGP